jgi:cell division protein FtsI/penicillin-binding protein 2
MIRTYRENPSWTIGDPQSVRRRVLLCGAALILIFALLLMRLWYCKLSKAKNISPIAQSNRTREVPISSPRG